MNKIVKKNKVLIIVAAILALGAVIIAGTRTQSTLNPDYRDFAVRDTASVTRLFMATKDGSEVLLRRKDNNQWWVETNDEKASSDAVQVMLETLRRIDIQRPVAKVEHDNVVRRLAAMGVKVEVFQNKPLFRILGIDFFTRERNTKTFYVGDATRDNRGTYMVMEDASVPFVVYIPGFRGFLSPRFKANPDVWRDHTIVAINPSQIKSAEVHHSQFPQQSFRLEKEDEQQFTITRLKDNSLVNPVDTLKVYDFLSSFRSVKYEGLLNDLPAKDSIINSQPYHVIRVTDNHGQTTEIKTYRRKADDGEEDIYGFKLQYDPDRLFASFNDGQDFALIQYYVFDHIIRPADFFKPGRSLPPAFTRTYQTIEAEG